MSEKRTVAEMFAEYLREAAVLVLVFAPLDTAVAGALTLKVVLGTLAMSAFLLGIGIFLEVRR